MKKNFSIIPIETFKKVSSLLLGNHKTSFRGSWIEFADIREYVVGDSVSDIDWKTTARTGSLHTRKYEEEREQRVLLFVDVGQSMNFSTKKALKWDLLHDIFLLIWLSVAHQNNPLGVYFFDQVFRSIFPAQKGNTYFQSAYDEFVKLQGKSIVNSAPHIIIDTIVEQKIKNHLIIIISDGTDAFDEARFRSIASQNDFLYIHTLHSFENNLDDESIYIVPQNSWLYIDTKNQTKKKAYKEKRKEELASFSHRINSLGGSYLFLDETKNIYQELYSFFRSRKNNGL